MSNTTQTPEQRIAHDLGLTLAEMGSIVRAERVRRKGPELVEGLRWMLDAADTEPGMSFYSAHLNQYRTLLAEIDAPIQGGA